jgi:tetratricopeptide (TPR) repeat protein
MSIARGIAGQDGRKTSYALLREKRGLRLALAFAAVSICWGWSLNWASGRSFAGIQTMGEQLWQFAPFFLGLAVCLICLGWASKVYWDAMVRSKAVVGLKVVSEKPSKRKTWIASQELKAMTTVFLAGTVMSWAVGFMSGDIAPAYARGIFLMSGAALWVVLIGAFFNMLRSKAPDGNWRKIAPVLIALPFAALAFTAILNDPSHAGERGPLYWGLGITLVAALLTIPASAVAGLVPVWLVRHGKFDLALRWNCLFFWALGNNRSTEGWILVMAGHYRQALVYLKPLAFDRNGHPRLTSQEFSLYASALSIEGEDETAELLYEAAVDVPQSSGDFHFGLADCLLKQKKDSDRARKLVECVLAGIPVNPRSNRQRANRAQMIAFHAWALASNGWRAEAEMRLQEVFASSSGVGKCSLAAIKLPVGDTWLTLGETEKARVSFKEALALFPFGDIGIRARKKLEALDARCVQPS